MITITVNCNDDTLIIQNSLDKRYKAEWKKLKSPIQVLEILEEILNAINNFGGAHESIDTKLEKIDEDTSTTVGEW